MISDNVQFPGDITCRHITIQDLAKDNESIAAIYKYRNTVADPTIRRHLDAVLRIASDGLCNLCHELNLDPDILDYWRPGDDFIVTALNPFD